MKKALFGILLAVGLGMALFLLILRKGIWGPLILVGLAAFYFVVTFASEAWKVFGPGKKVPVKVNGKKVQD